MNSPGKCEKRKAQDRKNELRRQYRGQVRQALLINDYIQLKHSEAYEEAANFYNYLNGIYPTKKDLRRTDEFKALKMGFTLVAKNDTRKYMKQVFQPIPTSNPNNFTLICHPIPEGDTEQAETVHPEGDAEQAETVHPEGDTEQAETVHPEGDAEQAETVHPEGDTEQAETVHPEGDTEQAETVHPEGDAEQAETGHQKIMQLRIPLLKPSVITQTVKVVTEEILEENPLQAACNEVLSESTQIHSTLNEEIPEEIIQKIIDELRQDPELHNVMKEIEQEIDLEQLDMCIDIPDDERLEQELNWEFW